MRMFGEATAAHLVVNQLSIYFHKLRRIGNGVHEFHNVGRCPNVPAARVPPQRLVLPTLVTKDYTISRCRCFVLPERRIFITEEVLTLKQQLEHRAQKSTKAGPSWKLSSKTGCAPSGCIAILEGGGGKRSPNQKHVWPRWAQLAAKDASWRSKPNRNVGLSRIADPGYQHAESQRREPLLIDAQLPKRAGEADSKTLRFCQASRNPASIKRLPGSKRICQMKREKQAFADYVLFVGPGSPSPSLAKRKTDNLQQAQRVLPLQ